MGQEIINKLRRNGELETLEYIYKLIDAVYHWQHCANRSTKKIVELKKELAREKEKHDNYKYIAKRQIANLKKKNET